MTFYRTLILYFVDFVFNLLNLLMNVKCNPCLYMCLFISADFFQQITLPKHIQRQKKICSIKHKSEKLSKLFFNRRRGGDVNLS